MAVVGYPDFQRVKGVSGAAILTLNQAFTATYNSPIFDVQEWNALQVAFLVSPNADFYSIALQFFGDAAGTIYLNEPIIVVTSGNAGQYSVPTQGPYFKLVVIPTAGGNAATVPITIYGAGIQSESFDLFHNPSPLANGSIPLIANQQASVVLPKWWRGKVAVNVISDTAAPARMRIDINLGDGAGYQGIAVIGVSNSNAGTSVIVGLPGAPLQLTFFNGATPQTVFYNLMALP